MSIGATGIAFVGYPVTSVTRAMQFYGELLGLPCILDHEISPATEPGAEPLRWVEFAVGEECIAVSNAWPPSGASGPGAALEVPDLDGAFAKLQEARANVISEIMESPSCRFFLMKDPDGNDLTIHSMKESH